MMQLETILIVDPDMDMRALMRQTISEAGFDVVEADSGHQGLILSGEQMPSLVLVRFDMPEMDGITFCQQLRSMPDGLDTPIILMAEADNIDAAPLAYDSGAADFMIRPVNWHLVCYRLRYILRASAATRAARSNEHLLSEAQRIASLGNWTWDLTHGEMQVSDGVNRIFGVPDSSPCVFHKLFTHAVYHDDQAALDRAIERAINGETADVELRIRRLDGADRALLLHIESSRKADSEHLLGTMQDITERKNADAAIRKLAFYDQVTGLPNRTLFQEHLSMAMHHAKRSGTKIAVLFLDLDNFKRINDSLGHGAGDHLLQEVSTRLQESIRASDLAASERSDHNENALARLGGDEFTVMLVDINTAHVNLVATRILESLHRPYMLEGNRVQVSSSIGIAIYPDDGDDVDTLLKHADAAMYQVKSSGRNGLFFYDDHLRVQSQNRIQLEGELYHALEHDQLTLFYQPKVDAKSLRISGFEALIRWIHPERGMIPPLDFIGVAEDSGLIIPMGKWVIKTACRQHRIWRKAGFGSISISVNLSCHQFADRQLLGAVREILRETGMEPACLEFEITESVLMQDADTAMLILSEMKKMGLYLSIDDFGTGYSSMAYLKHFPIDVLKVDRSFIMDLPGDEQEATITAAIIRLAHALDLKVVAEGVESIEQLNFLSALNCNLIQGYLFSPPVPAEKAERLINVPFTLESCRNV